MKDIPIKLMFYIFPFFSILAFHSGKGMLNYDFFWVFAFLFILVVTPIKKLKKKYFTIIITLVVLLIIKYFIPSIIYSDIQLKPLVMDAKWFVYLIFSYLWINKFNYPNPDVIYKGSRFFSILYIIYFVIKYIILEYDVARDGILMEANYDGFMILIGFCLVDSCSKNKKIDNIFFVLATLLTLSRTGLASLITLILYKNARKNILYLIPIIPVFLGMLYIAFQLRGESSAANLDRFVYLSQFYVLISSSDFANLLFGFTPGLSLNTIILPSFEWTVSLFENMHNIEGVFPFYFHSTYLRLVLSWGITGLIFYLSFFVYHLFKASYMPLKLLCLLTLIQSFSLSALTIQNVSILLLISFIVMLNIDKSIKYSERKLTRINVN